MKDTKKCSYEKHGKQFRTKDIDMTVKTVQCSWKVINVFYSKLTVFCNFHDTRKTNSCCCTECLTFFFSEVLKSKVFSVECSKKDSDKRGINHYREKGFERRNFFSEE